MALEMIINYHLVKVIDEADGQKEQIELLGTERSEKITQVLFPDTRKDIASVSLTKCFEGTENHRWKVLRVEHGNDYQIDVYLEPRKSSLREEFLLKTRSKLSNKQHISKRIQRGTLVEVEFGYEQSIKKSCGKLASNKRYPDMLHRGEMHKRRLCIVLGLKGTTVRVVPISSLKQDLSDKTIFELSYESLEALTAYNDEDIRSYALCGMAQTVSMSRVLPPMSVNIHGKKEVIYRNSKYPHRLSKLDESSLATALNYAVGCGDYEEIKKQRHKYFTDRLQLLNENKENQERLTLLGGQLATNKTELEALRETKKQFDALFEIMVDWKNQISQKNINELEEEIREEIRNYMELLETD
ncbi:type II toxin-antitoxin system PemK/MazF family toxin [uncultured Photobacterium sp.]|uniref:type II toxin-antitoxin system PemK/MazF family toxin n=1 Tax=uncultured Photobacterium sp. TaxID=173973 RepID=UPI0026230732|nr:type II toxin-antitoxin system PemK/MazF family toxin [uncultured Photobacterium sp.]